MPEPSCAGEKAAARVTWGMTILLFHYGELNIPPAIWYKSRYCHWLGLFDLWHFVEEAFSVWQNLLYSSGETELQCGKQREFGVSRDLCWQLSPGLVPDGRLGAPSGVLSPCPPSTSTSWEQRAQGTLGTVPTGLVVTQVAPVPYQLQPPG